jgi:hypothetical protein
MIRTIELFQIKGRVERSKPGKITRHDLLASPEIIVLKQNHLITFSNLERTQTVVPDPQVAQPVSSFLEG